jgi:hypothetical protein
VSTTDANEAAEDLRQALGEALTDALAEQIDKDVFDMHDSRNIDLILDKLLPVIASQAAPIAPPKSPLSDLDIDTIAESMPGGMDGFLKGWGWRNFARAVEAEVLLTTQPICADCGDGITAHDPGVCGTCLCMKYSAPTALTEEAVGALTEQERALLTDIKAFASRQKPLDARAAKVLYDNLWDLYATDDGSGQSASLPHSRADVLLEKRALLKSIRALKDKP